MRLILFAALTLCLAGPALAAGPSPATPGAECPTPNLPEGGDWTATEEALWPRICAGVWMRLNEADDLPCNPDEIEDEIPAARKISPEFLRLILTHPNYAGVLARPQVRLSCAEVTGRLDLENDEIAPELVLFRSRLSGGAVLRNARFHRSVFLHGSTLLGDLSADRLKTGGGLFLRGGATFAGDVILLGAEIGGNVETNGSTFKGAFNAGNLKTGGGLFLRGGARFVGDVRLLGAEIGGSVEADGSIFEGAFNADSLKTGGYLFLRGGARFVGDVILLGAEIGGSVEADGSTFEGAFNADRLKTVGSLFLRGGARFVGDVILLGAEIGGNAEADGSTFEGAFDAGGLKTGGDLFLRGGATFAGDVILLGAEIGGDVAANGSTFEGVFNADGLKTGGSLFLSGGATFAAVDLLSARIGGVLQFGGSAFNGNVDLTGADVTGEVLLSSPRHDKPEWGPEARLTLRNVSAAALQAELSAWRRADGSWVAVDLTGFSYDRLGGLHAEEVTASVNMADASAAELIAWIEGEQPESDARYDPQPYAQLAAALDLAGATRAADAVRYARFEHKRLAASTPFWERQTLLVRKLFIGHGVYPFRPLWWFAGLFAIGVIAAFWSRDEMLKGVWPKIWFSLENALPLVELKEDHKHVDHERAWVENVFQAQKVLGFVIATVLVGALSLLGG